jgi:hypothetical protein
MNAFVQKVFFAEPPGPFWKWRYVLLALVLILLAVAGWLAFATTYSSSPYHRYNSVLLFVMILFVHLTTQYRWSRKLFILLRIAAYVSVLLSLISLFYSSTRI